MTQDAPEKPSSKMGAATARMQHEVEEVFGRIARYTKFVLFGKWALAVLSLVILLTLVAWPILSGSGSAVRISFNSNEAGADGGAPVMERPRFQGTDKDGQPYTVVADRAIQKTETLVLLERLTSELSTQDAKWLTLNAESGAFEDKDKMLSLSGGVVIKHQDGHIVVTDTAQVDTNQAIASGHDAVEVQSPIGSLLATGFEIRDNGAYMIFGKEGRVTVQMKKSQTPKDGAAL